MLLTYVILKIVASTRFILVILTISYNSPATKKVANKVFAIIEISLSYRYDTRRVKEKSEFASLFWYISFGLADIRLDNSVMESFFSCRNENI